jgi:hypothetical protein
MQIYATSRHLPLLKSAGNAGLEVKCNAALRRPFPIVGQVERLSTYDFGSDLSDLRLCDLLPLGKHSQISKRK